MSIWIIISLSVLCAAAFTALFLMKYNLLSACRLLDHAAQKVPDRNLRLKVPQKDVEKLLVKVNELLDGMRHQESKHLQIQNELREQIANISHDLRTPLTSILGYIQLLESKTCTPQEREEYLSIIHKRSLSLQTLITGFYDLSRLELGGYHFAWEEVPLEKILYDLIAAFYYDFTEKQMEPVINVQKGLPTIWADREAVHRICANLISNALKHGRGKLYISAQCENQKVVIRFKNQADGLAEQDVDRLFERFYTADKMRTGQNTGLGLAIVAQLAEQMGACVSAAKQGSFLEITVTWEPSSQRVEEKKQEDMLTHRH